MKKSTKIIWSAVAVYVAISFILLGIGAEGLADAMAYYIAHVVVAAIILQLVFIYII